jgi:hypothetical protein
MAKKKGQPPVPDTATRPTRQGESVQFWMRADLAAAFRAYLDSLRPKPSKTAAIQDALEVYLEGKGFWPPEDKS